MSKDSRKVGGLSSWCKSCRAYSSRKWAKVNPEKVKSRVRVVGYEKRRNWMLQHRYGITEIMYQQLLVDQDYKCAICDKDSRDITYLLHTDHCHTTGVVRGLLCAPCNAFLGIVQDNTNKIQKAIDYLNTNKEINA